MGCRKKVLAFLVAGAALLGLAGCQSTNVLQINDNDTYSFETKLIQPQVNQEIKCKDRFPGIETQLKNPNLSVQDRSTDKQVNCQLSIKNQPISSAKAPFVTITHIGDRYRVKLEPFKDLDFIDAQADTFRLEIKFPGPVLDVGDSQEAIVDGQTVRWTSPSVIVNGFEVTGQDHPGMTRWTKWMIFLSILAFIVLVCLFIFRRHPALTPLWKKLRQITRSVQRVFAPVIFRLAEYLDISYRRSSRRKVQRPADTDGSTADKSGDKNPETAEIRRSRLDRLNDQ